MARGDVPGRGLGQERLVCHMRLWVDDRDLSVAPAKQSLGQPQRRIQADVTRADDENSLWTHTPIMPPRGCATQRRSSCRLAAALRSGGHSRAITASMPALSQVCDVTCDTNHC